MRVLTLKRICEDKWGAFGVLIEDGHPICLTLECQWKDNQRDISCIPEGEYICKLGDYSNHPHTFEVTGVPNRDAILFHKGNWQKDSKGCILLGESYGFLNGEWAILNSAKALSDFMKYMNEIEFKLIVKNALFAMSK